MPNSTGHNYCAEVLAGYGKWLLTGGPFLVENIIKRVKPSWIQWLDKKIPAAIRLRIEIGIMLIAVFIAGFLAWRDEHRARLALAENHRAEPTSAPQKKYVCATTISAANANNHAMLFEFGVRGFTKNGVVVLIAIDQKILTARYWEASALRTDIAPLGSSSHGTLSHSTENNIYRLQFANPSLSQSQSEYVYIESEQLFNVIQVLFLEDINALSDQVKANKMASTYDTCPR